MKLLYQFHGIWLNLQQHRLGTIPYTGCLPHLPRPYSPPTTVSIRQSPLFSDMFFVVVFFSSVKLYAPLLAA